MFHVPEAGLTLQGLIRGLKESAPELHGAILTPLMQALAARLIQELLQRHTVQYPRNGQQSKTRQLRCSLGTIPHRFAQLVDPQEPRTCVPLVEALQIPAYAPYLDEALEPPSG